MSVSSASKLVSFKRAILRHDFIGFLSVLIRDKVEYRCDRVNSIRRFDETEMKRKWSLAEMTECIRRKGFCFPHLRRDLLYHVIRKN